MLSSGVRLGFQLLDATPAGVTLTLAGAVFLEKARAILAATEDAVLTAESLARADQGTIAFGYVGPARLLGSRA